MGKRINIKRGNAPSVRRGEVTPGTVFRNLRGDGRAMEKDYLHITNNGRFFSINLETGAIASTRNGNKRVRIQGQGQFLKRRMSPVELRRDQLQPGDLFTVRGGTVVYGQCGKVSGGWLALNMGNMNHTLARDGDHKVVKVGTWSVATRELG